MEADMASAVVISAWIGVTPVTEWVNEADDELTIRLRLLDPDVSPEKIGDLDSRFTIQASRTADGNEVWSSGVRWAQDDTGSYLVAMEVLNRDNLPRDLDNEVWLRACDETNRVVALTWIATGDRE
jgi:hypothetical protein